VVSNEPGYYKAGKFGIRIENLLRVKIKNKKYIFDNLTMAPIDKFMIRKSMLNNIEVNWLNDYHSKVYKNLINFMSKSEALELKKLCSNIK